ncbi:hypothetical protein HPB49_011815 [Dermacentor silvarum]|uniref:Uncharacterized protein n=1 Tax=Dermacentor silvarum TaxID=543639 RepID=A0ACB8CX67_DERSI|nr:hypothetical protein HPB49_011815 [Dermacentor silvarum]
MSLARGYDPESMQVGELKPAKKPVFDEDTECVIRKKLEEQQRAAETRASSNQQEALHGGDAMNGHVSTSTPGKTLQPKRWKPKVVPKFGTEDTVAVVKPRGTLYLSNLKGNNQIGETMYAAAGVPSSSQALTIWPAWDQNIIIVGIRDAQFIRHVLAVESLRIGGRLQAVQVYLKMTDNTCRGVIQVDLKVSEADISEAIYSPDAPVVGVRKLAQSNAAAITFEGRKVPFNVFYWGEAVPVRLYRKTTPAFCGDPHLTGSADCTWKYRRGAGAGRKPGGGKSSNKRQARGARKDSGPGTQAQTQVAAPSPLPETRAATGAFRQGPQGSSRPADNHKIGRAGAGAGSAKTTGSKVSWAEVAASSAPTLAAEKLKEENSRLKQELAKYKTQKLSVSAGGADVPETPAESAMEEDASLPPTQQAEAPATEVVEKREEDNSNVVSGETDKKAAATQEESRIEADVERCLQRELPPLEARIAQNIQASLERTLQTIIERSVQAAIERGSHGAVERVLQGILQPHLIKLQAFEIRIDRKLQELADCTRSKSRGEQQRNLKRALHGFAGTDEQLVAALTSKYIYTMKDNEPVREYECMENPDLDRSLRSRKYRRRLWP